MLKKWAALPDLPDEERDLAKTLVDDFERFPTVDSMAGQLVGAAGLGPLGKPPTGEAQEDEPRVAELVEGMEIAPAADAAPVDVSSGVAADVAAVAAGEATVKMQKGKPGKSKSQASL